MGLFIINKLNKMKNWTEKSWGILVMTILSLALMLHVSCGVTKTTKDCDKEKKECCSKNNLK